MLNLQSNGQVVTVHTNVSYGLVIAHSVSLNDVEINSWKADNKGFFVAKFLMDDIKNLPLNTGELNTMTLTGETADGQFFTGFQEILVVDNIPSGPKNGN